MNVVMGVMNVVNMFWFWIYWRLIFEDGSIIKKLISAQPIKLYHWNLVRTLDRPWNLMDYFHFYLPFRNFCLINNIVPGLIFFQLWGFNDWKTPIKLRIQFYIKLKLLTWPFFLKQESCLPRQELWS